MINGRDIFVDKHRHAAVSNLFNLGRHLVGAKHYRDLRVSAFSEWSRAVA